MGKISAILVVLAVISTGCGAASMVRTDPHGGRIALDGAYMAAMGDARVLMAEHCHGRFEAVEDRTHDEVRFVCLTRPRPPRK